MTITPEHPSRLLLPAAILFAAVCLILPVEAFATLIDPYPRPCTAGHSDFNPVNMRTITSWIFAAMALLAAVKNFYAGRKKKEPVDVKAISIDVLAAVLLGVLPFAAATFSLAGVVAAGLVVALAGGWLCFRILRSVDMPRIAALLCAIGFALLLGWPLAYLDYQRLYPDGFLLGPCSFGFVNPVPL